MIAVHNHLLNMVLVSIRGKKKVRILDAGCGNLSLLKTLHEHLPKYYQGDFELYGYDLEMFYPSEKFDLMCKGDKVLIETDLRSRIYSLDLNEYALPWEDNYFDLVISNQVVEHVSDLGKFYGEITRILKKGCDQVHCFPSLDVVIEPHLNVPLIHRVTSQRLSLLLLKAFKPKYLGNNSYYLERLNYLKTDTNYMKVAWHLDHMASIGLKAQTKYNFQFIVIKIANIFGFTPVIDYAWTKPLDLLLSKALARLTSVTIFGTK